MNASNPLRLKRVERKMSQTALAEAARVTRSTLVAIEDGRTREPAPATIAALAAVLLYPTLQADLTAWHTEQDALGPQLTPHQQAILGMSPDDLTATYDTFKQWRQAIAPSAMAFSILLGMNHAHIGQYERGQRAGGMPEALQSAILNTLDVSPKYLVALMALPHA